MFHRKGPERKVVWPTICPVKQWVNHKGSCHIHDCLNGPFSTSILVLGTNTWKRLCLTFFSAVTTILLSREDAIVTMIMFNLGNTLVPKPLFKMCLSHDSFICTQGDLVLNPYQTWCCNIVDGTALKTTVLWFLSLPGRQTSGRLPDELVCRDEIAYLILVPRECSVMIFKGLRPQNLLGMLLCSW